MCYIGDAEQPKLFSQQTRIARKQHSCCECGSNIEPGERYEYVSGLWEDFCVFKSCLFCVEVREDYNSRAYEDERAPFEYLWDCVGYDYEEELQCPEKEQKNVGDYEINNEYSTQKIERRIT